MKHCQNRVRAWPPHGAPPTISRTRLTASFSHSPTHLRRACMPQTPQGILATTGASPFRQPLPPCTVRGPHTTHYQINKRLAHKHNTCTILRETADLPHVHPC